MASLAQAEEYPNDDGKTVLSIVVLSSIFSCALLTTFPLSILCKNQTFYLSYRLRLDSGHPNALFGLCHCIFVKPKPESNTKKKECLYILAEL